LEGVEDEPRLGVLRLKEPADRHQGKKGKTTENVWGRNWKSVRKSVRGWGSTCGGV